MDTINRMGRRKLNREKANLTLPKELKRKAGELADATGKDLSRIVEDLLQPYVDKHWTPDMHKDEDAKTPKPSPAPRKPR
ncbi:MAG TPA: hypothetical protein VGN72_01240 [Tepidisphaeraceae bacterium]|jgi:hypothetical protein|nr:hypothetical protein [Tepidisphaeraceae bacterium]